MAQDKWGLEIRERPKEPHTSFQTPTGYLPENDIRTDAMVFYRPFETTYSSREAQTWQDKGYIVQTMYGFRAKDGYLNEHMDEGQTDASGRILAPMHGSYYMVPTQGRIDVALGHIRQAIQAGSSAIIAEEPEFFARAGYSEAFKREWLDYYGEPWQDPASSTEARYKADRLKGFLKRRIVQAMLSDAHRQDPSVIGAAACHSPLSYYGWSIICPHYELMRIPDLQEMIGQVWTGTARTACTYEGISAERTFEYGYLEYSSFANLMRGTGKRLWFLMDPLEDNPERTMEDYQTNYERTLVASLMFPEVDSFEVMPWPTRIYGHVPDEFATKIGTIVNLLGDIHRQESWELDSGTQGIATFVADSMAWQREDPHPSNFDCFYGLTMPLITRGIPVQVAQLERTVEPGYLDPYKVLLISYDMMKPTDPAHNTALADWVKAGGTLILFGGTDAYNELPEWWSEAGFHSPHDHLLSELGVYTGNRAISSTSSDAFVELLSADPPASDAGADPRIKDLTYVLHLKSREQLPNRGLYTVDLTDYVQRDGSVAVKIENAGPDEGLAPLVFSAELEVDGRTQVSFAAGSDEESAHILHHEGSQFNGAARTADGRAYWIYGFQAVHGGRVELTLDMANLFRVSAASEGIAWKHHLKAIRTNSLTSAWPEITIPSAPAITSYRAPGDGVYRLDNFDISPVITREAESGTLIFVGIAPSYFASSKESAGFFRSIVSYGCEQAGVTYQEQGYIKMRRGRYVAVRSFDQPVEVKGEFVDALDPGLRILTNPVIPPGRLALLADIGDTLSDSMPRVLLASDRIEASRETADSTRLRLTGPLKTKGIVRVASAGRQPQSVEAADTSGKAVPVDWRMEQSTLVAKYDSLPDGVLIGVEWG